MNQFTVTFAGATALNEFDITNTENEEIRQRLENEPFSFFQEVAPLVSNSDEVCINLKTAVHHDPQVVLEDKKYLKCDSPDKTKQVLNKLGVSLASLHNNHSMDFGIEGMLSTINCLQEASINFMGAGENLVEAEQPYTITLKGNKHKNIHLFTGLKAGQKYEKYGFFAEDDKPGINPLNEIDLIRQIALTKENDPDSMIIIMPYWQGYDYKWTSKSSEIKRQCRNYLKMGADYVINFGPHMLNDVEKREEGTIVYGMGNFVFNTKGSYRKNKAHPYSWVIRFTFTEKEDTWEIEPRFYPIVTDNRRTGFSPRPINESEARKLTHLLHERAGQRKSKTFYGIHQDELGFYYTVMNG